ncbi:hypothetical protein PRIC1_000594 [Phytophthora ramorum]|nr:hypothetical protein KRP22_12378 [Phytophthora ramorum]
MSDSNPLQVHSLHISPRRTSMRLSKRKGGIFTLALVLLNSWVGHGAEALDAAQASGPLFVGGSVVEKSCDGCTPGPMVHTLLKHTDDRN